MKMMAVLHFITKRFALILSCLHVTFPARCWNPARLKAQSHQAAACLAQFIVFFKIKLQFTEPALRSFQGEKVLINTLS